MELIILLYTFSVISWYKDVLPAFTCASATGNLRSLCLGVNIFNPFPLVSIF